MTVVSVPAAPVVARAAAVTGERAVDVVTGRLRDAEQLDATLFHHPFLGLVLRCGGASRRRRTRPRSVIVHVAVDLVGGQAYVTEPWDPEELVDLDGSAVADTALVGPRPVVAVNDAVRAAEDAVNAVMLRRRRWVRGLELERIAEPLVFGKPNWWVTGRHRGNPVEVVVDGITGRHFAFRA